MIWFHTIPILPEVNSLMGNGVIPHKTIIPFTLFGFYTQGETLSGLYPDPDYIPREAAMRDTEADFDYWYWKQLLECERSAFQVYKIMYHEYLDGVNNLICISTQDSPYRNSVTESLMNFLNVMYGVDPKIINSLEDLYDPGIYEPGSFSRDGIMRITRDMETYTGLTPTPLSFIPED